VAELLVPVGRHLFTPEYLNKLASTVTPSDVGPHGIAGKLGVDNEGVNVAVLFTPKGDHLVARVAYRYSPEDGHQFGADATFKF
jgi:hypothetical protein